MIELNLIPEEFKKKRTKIALPEIPIIPIVGFLVGGMVILQVFLFMLIGLSSRQLASLDKKWEEMAPDKRELDKIKRDISLADRKSKGLEELVRGQLNWARILNELSNSMTANIWLSDLSYDERIEVRKTAPPAANGANNRVQKRKDTAQAEPQKYAVRSLRLSGYASGRSEEAPDYISRFVNSLKGNKTLSAYFDDIDQGPMQKAVISGEEVMSFTVTCTFKPEKGA